MVELKILSGKKAGATWAARHFPVRIGRAPNCELQAEDEGVWDQHLHLELKPLEGMILRANDQALTRVNGAPVHRTVLRNGDQIEIGSLKMRFWLTPTRQRGL